MAFANINSARLKNGLLKPRFIFQFLKNKNREGRNAAGGKLGKKRAVIPSTENVLFSKELQLCGCG